METFPENYRPSLDEAQIYLKIWDTLPNYLAHDRALGFLFRGENSPFTGNDNLESIIIKTSALNDFYSTNIRRIFDVANTILSTPDVDKRLAEGDLTLVKAIRITKFIQYKRDKTGKIAGNECEIDNYSFATKYCSHHQPDKFPIYDKYVAKVLCKLRDIYPKVFKFTNKDLRDYKTFTKQLDILRKEFNLEMLSYKDLDRYLWRLGKRYFSTYVDAVNGPINYPNK